MQIDSPSPEVEEGCRKGGVVGWIAMTVVWFSQVKGNKRKRGRARLAGGLMGSLHWQRVAAGSTRRMHNADWVLSYVAGVTCEQVTFSGKSQASRGSNGMM